MNDNSITYNLRPPLPGEKAILLCQDCKHSFSGTIPQKGLLGVLKKTRCPNCKSTNVILNPAVKY